MSSKTQTLKQQNAKRSKKCAKNENKKQTTNAQHNKARQLFGGQKFKCSICPLLRQIVKAF